MNDEELIGFPPQVIAPSAHGHERSLTVTVGRVKDCQDENHTIRVTVSHGKHSKMLDVPNNPHVVSAAIGKLARELTTQLDKNQTRIKKILGKT